ncbi:MAG TPA: hypothetical protein VIV11_05570 [Kofleriaceae bacterium]
MGGMRVVVSCLLAAGCLPRPEPAKPQAAAQPQYVPPPQYAPQQQYAQQQQPIDPNASQQPATATAQGGVTVTPAPQAPQQPAPQAQPQQPPPLPPNAGYYPQPQPAYYPYAQQPYAQQPYAQQPYAYPAQPLPPPGTVVGESSGGSRRLHDGEVIADFAIVGTFAALDILSRQTIENGSAVGFVLVAGLAGGGGIGYALTSKYEVDAGAAHATTLGLTLGFANGALLIEPTGWEKSSSVLHLLFLGSAAGAAGGFIYGQAADLTSGQSLFVANMTLLGSATAALTAIAGSQDGQYGSWENGALAIGIDGGAVAGAVIAPSLDWSARRAKVVFASTTIGALVGGMFAGLLSNNDGESRTDNGDVVTGAMTAGLWGGFGLGVMMTKDYNPDPKFINPQTDARTRTASKTASSPTSIVPWVGASGQLGVMTGGSF